MWRLYKKLDASNHIGTEQRKELKMNLYLTFTDIRSHLSHKFFTLRTDARREALWAKLMGNNTTLALFPEEAPEKSPNRKFIGTEDILVERIVGTISRKGDFDYKFRPVNKHLRERWVNAYIAFERDGWTPILVHKVGDHYYVEDGHHRVSIARSLGLRFLPATVWEYPCLLIEPKPSQTEACPSRSSTRVYAHLTD
jgi:hypothetical protein